MWPNLQETADLILFTEENLNRKFHFFMKFNVCIKWNYYINHQGGIPLGVYNENVVLTGDFNTEGHGARVTCLCVYEWSQNPLTHDVPKWSNTL